MTRHHRTLPTRQRTHGVLAALMCVIALLCWGAPAAVADGKVFPLIDYSATIPDQQALMVWDADAKRQTMVIETRFVGGGAEFAWVVPCPSVPEVSAATVGLFPTLQRITEPRLNTGEGSMPLTALAAVAWCALLAALAPGPNRTVTILVVIAGMCALAIVFMPALGKARSSAIGDGVEVLSRHVVGDFDTVTVRGSEGGGIAAWLRGHGFALDAGAEAVIGDYAHEGWCFVASRLRDRAHDDVVRTPHPLSFAFATERPVYPMRLTAAGSTALALDLYVLADGVAAAPGLAARWVRRVFVPGKAAPGAEAQPGRPIEHPALERHVGSGRVLTRLAGTLSEAQMRQDLAVTTSKFETEVREEVFTPGAASRRAWAIGLWSSWVVMAVVCATRGRDRPPCRRIAMGAIASIAVGAAAGGVVLACTQVATVTTRARSEASRARAFADHLGMVVIGRRDVIEGLARAPSDADRLALVREAARSAWADEFDGEQSDRPMPHETDAPGGYTMSIEDGSVVVRWFDPRAGGVREFSEPIPTEGRTPSVPR